MGTKFPTKATAKPANVSGSIPGQFLPTVSASGSSTVAPLGGRASGGPTPNGNFAPGVGTIARKPKEELTDFDKTVLQIEMKILVLGRAYEDPLVQGVLRGERQIYLARSEGDITYQLWSTDTDPEYMGDIITTPLIQALAGLTQYDRAFTVDENNQRVYRAKGEGWLYLLGPGEHE